VSVLAHLGHALPLLPFFGPPLLVIGGVIALMVHDRMRGDDDEDDIEAGSPTFR